MLSPHSLARVMPPPEEHAPPADTVTVEVLEHISDVDEAQWNRLSGRDYPFLRHEFLAAAETTGCVSPQTGWQPRHLVLFDARKRVRAAMPLYEKTHSWGEFVFDWAWAHAYERAGLEYYPRLVSAAPFTPAQSPRILLAEADDQIARRALIQAAVQLTKELEHSSLHVQFVSPSECNAYEDAGLKLRKDCQFHWHNRGYASFDEFLAGFSARKRKKARRDRQHVREQGISFRHLTGRDLDDAALQDAYDLISLTFLKRGSMPYFSLEFFREFAQTLPEQLMIVLAEIASRPIAAAICYRGADALYGRYWGSDGHYNALHFETCYYQGIEYCIEHGIGRFEPGTQGEHKISRGFEPVTTYSAHWLARPEFFAAIGDYLQREGDHIDDYIDEVNRHTPFRKNAPDDVDANK